MIVNDGSTDNGASVAAARGIMARNAAGDFGGARGGSGSWKSRMAALPTPGTQGFAAAGEWIFPLDSDDLIGPDFLERGMRWRRAARATS